MSSSSIQSFQEQILGFFESMRFENEPCGCYRYASGQTQPVLYASIYSALARHLLNDLGRLTASQRTEWISYIQSFQAEDGFFKDPIIAHPGSWYVPPHMDWCGWWHLSAHAIMALTALDAVASREFAVLKSFYDESYLRKWLEVRDRGKMDFVGNEILNLGQLLQYARDFHQVSAARPAMEIILDWLDKYQDPRTGLWGLAFDTPQDMNKAYQGAYHFYLLYEYDRRPVRLTDRIIDSMLSMQTPQGGFGIHENTSGCEDIDALDPLARFSRCTSYRHEDLERALTRTFDWVLQNRTLDGGFAFIKDHEMFYGSKLMYSGQNEGSTFATWWRMLSLAIMSQVVKQHELARIPWQFIACPGYQFWR